MNKWNQKQFNLDHSEPRDYGEGDVYVVGDQFADEEVAEMITEWENSLTGEEREFSADDVGDIPIGIGKNEDGEIDWVVLGTKAEQKPVAWGKGIYN